MCFSIQWSADGSSPFISYLLQLTCVHTKIKIEMCICVKEILILAVSHDVIALWWPRTSSRSVLRSFWAAALALDDMDPTAGLPAISTDALGMISVGIIPGDIWPRYGLNAAAAAAAAALVARFGVTENIGWK